MISVGSSRWMATRTSRRCSSSRTSCFCATRKVASCAPVRPPPAMSTNTSGPLLVQAAPELLHAGEAGAHVHHVPRGEDGLRGGQRGAPGTGVGDGHALRPREELAEALPLPRLAHRELVDLDL